jgi:hypothetical protein
LGAVCSGGAVRGVLAVGCVDVSGVAPVSDPTMAVLTFAVGAVAIPLAFLAAWSLFKGLLS